MDRDVPEIDVKQLRLILLQELAELSHLAM